MNKQVVSLLVIFTFVIFNSYSQKAQSITIEGNIAIRQTDETTWLERYQEDIDKYIVENRNSPDLSCDALFLGSSSFNLWKNIHQDLAPIKIIRRSYGGSTLRDMIYNYNVIARGYKPKVIVLYVENDLGSWSQCVSTGRAFDLFRLFEQKIHEDYPQIPLYIVSLKPSAFKKDYLNEQLALNLLLKEYANENNYVEYIDITKDMYDGNGVLKSDIFEDDNLHLNQKGYNIWVDILKPTLLKGL